MSDRTEKDEAEKPDFQRIDPAEARQAEFPVKVSNEFRVHFDRKAYDRMKAHAATTSEVELCGVLVGEVCRDNLGFFLSIIGVIEGEAANNYGAQVTFTHDTWSHIHETMDRDYPDRRIVGWYHTHPGFGVFLSKMDMFIQENFFPQPYQVAVVLETKAEVEGCFVWSGGRVEPLRRYWAGDEEVHLSRGPVEEFDGQPSGRERDMAGEEEPGGILGTLADVVLKTSFLPLILIFLVGLLLGRLAGISQYHDNLVETQRLVMYSLAEKAAVNASVAREFDLIQSQLQAVQEQGSTEESIRLLSEVEGLIGFLKERYQSEFLILQEELRKIQEYKAPGSRSSRPPASEPAGEDEYVRRLTEILGRTGAFDPKGLTPEKQDQIKACLDEALKKRPESKKQVREAFPGMIEYFYPESTSGSETRAE